MAALIGIWFGTVALERRCGRLPWEGSGVGATSFGPREPRLLEEGLEEEDPQPPVLPLFEDLGRS